MKSNQRKWPQLIGGVDSARLLQNQTVYARVPLLGGDVTFVLGGSGHIAGVINPPAKQKRNHWVGDVRSDARDWLTHAREVPGVVGGPSGSPG